MSRFDFNPEIEWLIYRNMMEGHIKKKKDRKKLQESGKADICTYDQWEKYITVKYKGKSVKSLRNVEKYLEYKLAKYEQAKESYRNIFIPICIIPIINCLISYVEKIYILNWKIASIFMGVICISIFWSFYRVFKFDTEDLGEQASMYKNYMEIIEQLINEKTAQ